MYQGLQVGVFDLVKAKDDASNLGGASRTRRRMRLFAAAILFLDLTSVLLLFLSCHGWSFTAAIQAINVPAATLFSLRTEVFDVLVLTVARLLFIPILSQLAVACGSTSRAFKRDKDKGGVKGRGGNAGGGKGGGKGGKGGKGGTNPNLLSDPLLGSVQGVNGGGERESKEYDDDGSSTAEGDTVLHAGAVASAKATDTRWQSAKKAAACKRGVFLGLIFVLSVGSQVYIGIKTLHFAFPRSGGSGGNETPMGGHRDLPGSVSPAAPSSPSPSPAPSSPAWAPTMLMVRLIPGFPSKCFLSEQQCSVRYPRSSSQVFLPCLVPTNGRSPTPFARSLAPSLSHPRTPPHASSTHSAYPYYGST